MRWHKDVGVLSPNDSHQRTCSHVIDLDIKMLMSKE